MGNKESYSDVLISMGNIRKKIEINGIVQGVGFRPFVYRTAKEYRLSGFVGNTTKGVMIEVEGREDDITRFIHTVHQTPPVRSRITQLSVKKIPNQPDSGFIILQSTGSRYRNTLISPDIATCDDCLSELFDPSDRRYRYPFINCTQCGPRYTIIQNIPYDRQMTTMQRFVMCPACQKEYDDPENRRFHAQPNACPLCGPSVWMTDTAGNKIQTDQPVDRAVELLKAGAVLAVKGLGGFHLACDARNACSVRTLRKRKNREEKPLAVMVQSLKTVRSLAQIHLQEERLLLSPERPIVILDKKHPFQLVSEIAPQNHAIGLMLPYTPLHHLLMAEIDALVMTSGNISEEPIVFKNEQAINRLGLIADYFLMHNRDIYMRNDDSVTMVVNQIARPVRRSRGIVPVPVFIPKRKKTVLAVGGEKKNTIAFLNQDRVFLSHHIGDMENAETLESFQHSICHLKTILSLEPELIAYDLHPDYLSTHWALEQPVPVRAVQHHHAHIASCMAENGFTDPVIGIAMDGSGYGLDSQIWGGEFLVADFQHSERMAHFVYQAMPGGEQAILEPWRMALSILDHEFGDSVEKIKPFLSIGPFSKIEPFLIHTVIQMIQQKENSPMTSSLGRIFDAVSFLCGGPVRSRFEGQAAVQLEQKIENSDLHACYQNGFQLLLDRKPFQISPGPLFRALLDDLQKSTSPAEISLKFHNSLIQVLFDMIRHISGLTGLKTVALSGGCFQNRVLLRKLTDRLQKDNFKTLTHQQVPCNDGGLSLGQAVIGASFSA
jgi:hydrogenase maturation protein HypF